MKINVETQKLLNITKLVNIITNKKYINSVYKYILLETNNNKLLISVNSGDVYYTTEINAEIIETGSVLIVNNILQNILNVIKKNKILLIKENENLIIKNIDDNQNNFTYKINTIDINYFERKKINTDEKTYKVNALEFKKTLEKSLYYMSNDKDYNNTLLQKVNDVLYIISQNGKKLAVQKIEINNNLEDFTIVIPETTIKLLSNLIKNEKESIIELQKINKEIIFKYENNTLFSSTIENKHPTLEKILNVANTNSDKTIEIDRNNFIKNLKSLNSFVNSDNYLITLQINNKKIEMKTTNSDGEISSIMEINYDNDEIILTLNYYFLLDILNSLENDKILLEISSSLIRIKENNNIFVLAVTKNIKK